MKRELINYIGKTDSTNSLLKKIINYKAQNNSQLPEIFTIFAGGQTSGRGLGKNKWESEEGQNLLCSMYFRPKISPNRQFAFNQCFALAVRNTIAHYVDNVYIKWPNDIYVDDKKIAGILIEHVICGESIQYTIAGVGINVNQKIFPKNIPNPISLANIIAKTYEIREVLENLLAECVFFYKKLTDNKLDEINSEYLSHLYKLNEFSAYKIFGKIQEAKIIGVNAYGQLMVENSANNLIECNLKEISFIV